LIHRTKRGEIGLALLVVCGPASRCGYTAALFPVVIGLPWVLGVVSKGSLRDAAVGGRGELVIRVPWRWPLASACCAGANVTPRAGVSLVEGRFLWLPASWRSLPLRDGRRSLG